MSTIIVDDIIVTANFDSGTFMNSFSVSKKVKDYSEINNIQNTNNLTFEDFDNLSTIIAISVNSYSQSKGK